jgi:hypothetical protein
MKRAPLACPRWTLIDAKVVRLSMLCLVACAGCGGSLTQAVSGTVTLDGAPLATGEIEFAPEPGTKGPAAGATIENGRFDVPAVEQGLRTGGTYAVRITSLAGRGNFAKDPNAPGGRREALENTLQREYGTQIHRV